MAAATRKGPPPRAVRAGPPPRADPKADGQASAFGSAPPPTGSPVPDVAAVPDLDRVHEPVWLVRIVLALFLVGFAAFLAREVSNFVSVLP